MKAELAWRHFGVHELVNTATLPGVLADYARLLPRNGPRWGEYQVDEDKLLAFLPDRFLPVPANQVLLLVGDQAGSTGQVGLSRFRNYAKYFDAYSLTLREDSTDG